MKDVDKKNNKSEVILANAGMSLIIVSQSHKEGAPRIRH
jgi:hypothetical protein